MTRRTYLLGLFAAVLLQYIILALYSLEIIPQQFNVEGHLLWFHHGGDSWGYYAQLQSLVRGEFTPNKYPLGFPILMIPFAAIMQPTHHNQLVEPVATFWAVVMFPIGQLVLATLAEKITKRRSIALLTVFIWTALPLISWAVLMIIWNPTMAEIVSVHLPWVQMLSDGPATLFTLLGFLVYWMARERDFPVHWVLLLGWVLGFLMLIRLTGALTVGAIGLLLLLENRWKPAIVMSVMVLIIFSPQMIYNYSFFDSPFTTGYNVLDEQPTNGLFNISYLLDASVKIWEDLGWLTFVALGIGGFISLWGLSILSKRYRFAVVLLVLWIVPYTALYSIYYYSWVGGFLRFLMPMYPAIALIAAALLLYKLPQQDQHT